MASILPSPECNQSIDALEPADIEDLLRLQTLSLTDTAASATNKTSTLRPAGTTSGSRLKTLPAEIRNLIYAFAVAQETPIKIKYHKNTKLVHCALPALSAVDRQFRDEVTPMFFAENVFIFTASDNVESLKVRLQMWLIDIGPYVRDVRHVGAVSKVDGSQRFQELVVVSLPPSGGVSFSPEACSLSCTCKLLALPKHLSTGEYDHMAKLQATVMACSGTAIEVCERQVVRSEVLGLRKMRWSFTIRGGGELCWEG